MNCISAIVSVTIFLKQQKTFAQRELFSGEKKSIRCRKWQE